MNANELTPELRALASQSFQHQTAGRFAEAAQGYAAVLARAPELWSACYNLGLVYQHLSDLPRAAEMYLRAVRLNPQLAEAYNNLGNVFRQLKEDDKAIDAYRRATGLNPHLSDASYNLAIMLQARGDMASACGLFQNAVTTNPLHTAAWDSLYRALLALDRHEEANQAFLAWDLAMQPCPELVVAGLALCRPIGDRALEARYVALAIEWPFVDFTPEQFAPILGMIQYFDVSREQILGCYRRYDAAVAARRPRLIPMLPRRSQGPRLRVGYLSPDFRRHVMGRWMLDVISRHDRARVSIFLVSTCAPGEHDAVTAEFRAHADGFADISALDDFAAAKSIAEADLDVLVDLAGHTMAARPGIYSHRPARSIVTHLGYHGCLGMSAVDYKLTDRIADPDDAAQFQIERPFVLDTCVFPFVRVAPSEADPALGTDLDLEGKFVFAAFTNVLKLSARCLEVWRRVLEVTPEAVLLFSPPSSAQRCSIERIIAAAGIDKNRIAFLNVPNEDGLWRARYRIVDAVLDTFPYAGGDTTLAALDMGVPVVTLAGARHSERVGASILTHLGVTETIAQTEDEFVAIAVKLARNQSFMARTRQRIGDSVAATDTTAYTRALEEAYEAIAARKPTGRSMSLTAREFFQRLRDTMLRHRRVSDASDREAVIAAYEALRIEQPDYPPLLRAEGEFAQESGNLALAGECANALLRLFPDDLDVRLSLAGFLIDDGAATEALDVLPPVENPAVGDVRVLKLYTRAHAKSGRWETALRFSQPAVAMAPADVPTLFWHGMVLLHTGNAEEALTFLNRALILAPDSVEAAYNAGVILGELGNLRDAEIVFRRALSAPAAKADAAVRIATHLRLLQLLSMQDRFEEWIVEGQRFASAHPELERSRLIESRIARQRGQLDREAEILLPLAEAASAMKDDEGALDLIAGILATLTYHDVPAHLLQRLAERFKAAACSLHPLLPSVVTSGLASVATSTGERSLRVGYLADLSHPFVADFVINLIRQRDPERVAARVYSLSPVEDTLRESIISAGATLVSVATFDERRAAEEILRDGLDVLVDAASFGPYAKPGILSYRPARVQIALPGFTCPAGIGEFDFRLSDHVADFGDGQNPDSLLAILLEGCVFPLLPAVQPRAQLTRSQLGVAEGVPLFGVLAAADRISARCLTTWKGISDRLPAAVFFVCPLRFSDREPIARILLKGGIDAKHILMMPASMPRSRDLCLRDTVDVILDVMPGSDYFSARAAILDSIPLVTIPGRMPYERVALSLLSHLGDTSTVAASGRDYVDLALQLVLDQNLRATRVDSMRKLIEGSVMADVSQYVARFEEALFRAAGTSAAKTPREESSP